MENAEKLLEGLNAEQYLAATTINGAVRLIAGAGSGKTFTLTKRVAYICAKTNIAPNRVLSLTFTNKAAAEMRGRVAKVLNVSEDSLNMKTFHSLAVEIVKMECKDVFGWHRFSIGQTSAHILVPQFFKKHPDLLANLTDEEKISLKKYLVGKVYNALNSDYYIEWLDKKSGRVPLADTADVMDYMHKNEEATKANDAYKRAVKTKDFKKIKEKAEYYNTVALPYVKGSITPVGTWVRQIVQDGKRGICSFDDLVKCAKYLLETYPEIRDYWSNQYDYIQVDEFQDTDFTQLSIVKALYERHGNLFVVGDPDQSIYLFRGAEPTLFNNLSNYIPNLKTIFMNHNYRSTEEIVEVSNSVIELNRNRIPKTCDSQKGAGSKVIPLIGDKDAEKTGNKTLDVMVVETIQDLIKKGVSYDDIAILYRNTKDNIAHLIQQEFDNLYIPYVSTLNTDSKYGVFTLGLCKYQYTKDETFLVESANKLDNSNGFNPPTILVDLDDLKQLPLELDAIFAYLDKANYAVSKKDGKPLTAYKSFLDNKLFIQRDILSALNQWNNLSDEDKQALCNPMDLQDDAKELTGSGIKIMTMHKSKGLEFPYVFVLGLSNSVMSSARDSAEEVEEQARLIYVAYSRAKTQLYICSEDYRDIHGTLGKVLLDDEVEQHLGIVDLDATVRSSINAYLDSLDAKTKSTYTPIYKDEPTNIIGYRCTYCMSGEKVAYQATIEDLKRLNCVPVEQKNIVIVNDAIPVAFVIGKNLICFDEVDKAIKRVTLTEDADILTVFGNSNKLYVIDEKDAVTMRGLRDKLYKKPTQQQVQQNVQPTQVQQPVQKSVQNPVNQQTKPVQQVIQPTDNKLNVTFEQFRQFNDNKPVGIKTRVVEVQDADHIKILNVATKEEIVCNITNLVMNYVGKGELKLTNPTALQNYGFWQK